ncbi:hypothetical protein GUITHDRAFT_155911, partial [Guillardia theta CCMP2712]
MPRRWAFASLALMIALVCTCFILLRNKETTILKDVTVAYIRQQATLMKQKNQELQKEDRLLEQEEKAEERYVLSERKAKRLAEEAKRNRVIQIQNAKLLLENEKLKNKVLREEMEARKARIFAMKESIKAGDYSRSFKSLSPDSSLTSPSAESPAQVKLSKRKPFSSVKQVKLAGKHVKACVGTDCRVRYVPEDVKDWEAANHTMVVMGNGIGVPLGPTVRTPLDPSLAPLRDLPKSATTGQKVSDSISREM